MNERLKLHLRDLSPSLVAAWRTEFAGEEDVSVSCGDIFSERSGMVQPEDPIDLRADAVVSPANSFGFMDGGIDAVFTYTLGPQVQQRLQALLRASHGGELPVGQAVIVPTDRSEIPWCISAPTMRVPANISDTVNAYLAFRAALRAIAEHNAQRPEQAIKTVLCPGLGTAVGRMPPERCARQMHAAWQRVVSGGPFVPSSLGLATKDEVELRK
ncbi:MAG: macro domain-containing protein [Myxococcales bacterium]